MIVGWAFKGHDAIRCYSAAVGVIFAEETNVAELRKTRVENSIQAGVQMHAVIKPHFYNYFVEKVQAIQNMHLPKILHC